MQVRFLVDGGDRESAPACQVSPVLRRIALRGHQVEPPVIAGTHELLPDSATTESPLLTARHRPQTQVARASGQGLGDSSHEQQVCRSRQEELAGLSTLVYHPFHGMEQFGMPLYLVNGQRLVATHKCVRIAAGGVDHVQVVQGDIAAVAQRLVPCQCALACLTGASHHCRRHHPKSLNEARPGKPSKEQIIHIVDDNHSRLE